MGEFVERSRCGFRSSLRGFTLLEWIAAMGVMATLIALLVPAANGVFQQRSRKSAVHMLLNAFEQARVRALENSAAVYIGFAEAGIPDSGQGMQNAGFPYTRFILFRDAIPDADGSGAPPYIPLTKWLKLPDGISFSTRSPIFTTTTVLLAKEARFPAISSADYNVPVLKFNSIGMLEMPSTALWLVIYEGFYADGQDVFTRSHHNNLFERISFSRFTGRAQLDITSM